MADLNKKEEKRREEKRRNRMRLKASLPAWNSTISFATGSTQIPLWNGERPDITIGEAMQGVKIKTTNKIFSSANGY